MVLEALQWPDVRIALVGASNDPAKFGNRIFRDLVAKGYAVWPVNPREPGSASAARITTPGGGWRASPPGGTQ